MKTLETLDGYFIGKVIDSWDKNEQFRVRVSIEGLTDKIPKDKLPWYLVLSTSGNTYNQHGSIPPIGSYVLVKFEDDIYTGYVISTLSNQPPNEL